LDHHVGDDVANLARDRINLDIKAEQVLMRRVGLDVALADLALDLADLGVGDDFLMGSGSISPKSIRATAFLPSTLSMASSLPVARNLATLSSSSQLSLIGMASRSLPMMAHRSNAAMPPPPFHSLPM
jgi:hypothetical protein